MKDEKAKEFIEATVNGLKWRIENEPETLDKSDYEHYDNGKKLLNEYANQHNEVECKHTHKERSYDGYVYCQICGMQTFPKPSKSIEERALELYPILLGEWMEEANRIRKIQREAYAKGYQKAMLEQLTEMGEGATDNELREVIVNRRELLLDFADYSESDKTSQTTDECVDNYLDSIK